jgi:hypothetical protein
VAAPERGVFRKYWPILLDPGCPAVNPKVEKARREFVWIVTGAAEACHLTQRVHGFAFRRGLPDFLKQAASPLTTAGG